MSRAPPVIPEASYIVARSRLWRTTRPDPDAGQRDHWSRELMRARCAARAGPFYQKRTRLAREALDRARKQSGGWAVVLVRPGSLHQSSAVVNTLYADSYSRLEITALAIWRVV